MYAICATFYNIFGQGKRQPWDDPSNDVVHYYSQNKNEETDSMLNRKNLKKWEKKNYNFFGISTDTWSASIKCDG